MSKLGAVVLSFDLELAWGAIESGPWRRREKEGVYRDTRNVVQLLLKTMDELSIVASWAAVGGLMESKGSHKLDHLPCNAQDQIAQALETGRRESFEGMDIIEMIRRAKVGHELCCHSYSHTRVDYPEYTSGMLEQELYRFEEVCNHSFEFKKKFIFPRNIIDFTDVLYESGYKSVRAGNQNYKGGNLILKKLYPAFACPILSNETVTSSGVRQVSGSLFFNSGYGKSYRVPLIYNKANRGLRKAIANRGALHVWAHPFNFAESNGLLKAFILFLEKVARLRDAGKIEIALF